MDTAIRKASTEASSMILRSNGRNWFVDWTIDGLTRTYRFDSRQSAINRFPSAKEGE